MTPMGRSTTGGEVFGSVQHAQRELERDIGRETRIMRAVSSHDCTYFAVVVRSSPFLPVGAAFFPLRDQSLS